MIIGKGMIAKAFSSYSNNKEVIIFASGVSNSLQNDEKEFQREKNLLLKSIKDNINCTFVYFGTCSVDDPELFSSSYVKHKKEMERIIEEKCTRYFIFRLSQVVGKSNSPTLINFIVDKIKNKEPFTIWKNSTRNLIDVDDVFTIADYLIENNLFINEVTNIAAPTSLSIFKIVNIVETLLDIKACYTIEERGGSYNIDTIKTLPILKNMDIYFNDKYPYLVIEKYYF